MPNSENGLKLWWCRKNSFFEYITYPKVYSFRLPWQKNEIKRLDLIKLDSKKGKQASNTLEITDAKCASKNCNYQGLNPQNKAAVGTCANCGNFEHFSCVKIKADHREDIQTGLMNYYSSSCFSKNPSQILYNSPKSNSKLRPRLDSLAILG